MKKTGKLYVLTVCAYTMLVLGFVPIVLFAGLVSNSAWGISAGLVRLLQAQLRESLKNGADADEIVRRVRQSLDYLKTLDPETLKIVRHAYSLATRAGFVVQGCLVAGAAVSAFWIREKKLSR
ncbi:MAG: hypothetical protein M1826_001533 [Phylliscum demangeonii]|nr:MAG: hypothetical protein M1826_001533 [Phylliscum demangeonii]